MKLFSKIKRLYFLWKERQFWKLTTRKPEEIFTEIYKTNAWGGKEGEFFSGQGSTSQHTDLYVQHLVDFIHDRGIRTIVELGCGDFRVMKRVVEIAKEVNYVGLDVVRDLIDFNQKEFGTNRIQFQQADIVDDALPPADLVLVRQVLQHLSNAQIHSILKKVLVYPLAWITEHVPIDVNAEPNVDKIAGPHIRMKANSGVFVDKPPFNVSNASVLFEYREDDCIKGRMMPAVIRTYLVGRSKDTFK